MSKFFTSLVLISLTFFANAQEYTVSGTLTDAESGEALIGATIVEKNSGTGTVADIEGNFKLAVSEDAVLIFSYVGYLPKEISVNGRTRLDVSLELNLEQLDEVVVVGYGTVRKSDLTGAISSVKGEDLGRVPAADPVQGMQGKVAGMQVLNASGNPGEAPIIRLRGVSTLNNNNPIFVVDGVIIQEGNSLDFLNANDIASIEVLKDASATAIFGSRGSNGVIIVSTKRGKKGAVRVNASAQYGVEKMANKIDVMNGREFATYLNIITPGTFNNLDALADVDWQDQIYDEYTPMQSYDVSISSATDKINYYFGMGYFSQQGIMPKSDLQRITMKLNTTYTIVPNMDLGLNLSVALKDKQNPPGLVTTSLWAWPIDEPFIADPQPDSIYAEVKGGGNALAAIDFSNNNTKSIQTVGNLYLDYDFLDGFTFKSSFQFSASLSKNRSFSPEFFVAPLQQNQTSDISLEYKDNGLLLWENTLSYNKEFGGIHRINVVAGYTSQITTEENLRGSAQNLLRSDESFWYIDSGDRNPVNQDVNNGSNESTIASMLFRANYSLMNRYLFTATIRRDGSSKFGVNNRYGTFPSFAVGWNISEEGFFPQTNFISNVKFRASWGIVGNDKINSIAQYSTVAPGFGAVFGDNEALNPGATYNSGGNPDLKWEETEQINFGLNADFLDSRLIAEVDYYVKTTNDILVELTPIGYSGIRGDITVNAATVENRGLDWSVNWRDRVGEFNYGIGFLGSTVSNEVKSLGENIGADSVLVRGGIGLGQQVARTIVGRPIGFFYGYDVVGVFQNQEQVDNTPKLSQQEVGDFIYRDANGDGSITTDDRIQIGTSIPKFIFGFSLNAGWKQFTVNADFQGQTGSDIYNGKQALRFAQLNYEEKFNNYWSGEGSTNEHPRPTTGGVNYQQSNYFVEDASFLRLRTLSLNYDLPNSVIGKIGANSARVFVRGTNLITWTQFTGYTPDLGANNALDGVLDTGVYPNTKIYTAGLNLTF